MRKYVLIAVIVFGISAFGAALPVDAQQRNQGNLFKTQARALGANSLLAGKTPVLLWGTQEIQTGNARFALRAKSILDMLVGSQPIECEAKSKTAEGSIIAQCTNDEQVDLGLYMIQQGYASADRRTLAGTPFQKPYIDAEADAQARGTGIWDDALSGSKSSKSNDDGSGFVLSLSFILFLCVLAAFTVLSVIIMRGFQRVIDAQNKNAEYMMRERKLRNKERAIIASMLDSEIKANKSKIEAYLVVYEEMLRTIKDPTRMPKYKESGDIVQKQPVLDRTVFDRNTDKIDSLGRELSSALIHFYARLKSNPDYVTLEPDMPVEEARAMVERAVEGAHRLNKLADKLMDLFENKVFADEGGKAATQAKAQSALSEPSDSEPQEQDGLEIED